MGPGYVVACDEPALLCAVSGNGIVVTLWDRYKRVGGMAHCIMARRSSKEKPTNYHVDVGVLSLIRQVLSFGPRSGNLEAQIFGGGSMDGWNEKKSAQLISAARKILKKFDISVVSEDVRGSLGRKIIFDTYSGDIVVLKTRKVRKSDWVPEYDMAKQIA